MVHNPHVHPPLDQLPSSIRLPLEPGIPFRQQLNLLWICCIAGKEREPIALGRTPVIPLSMEDTGDRPPPDDLRAVLVGPGLEIVRVCGSAKLRRLTCH